MGKYVDVSDATFQSEVLDSDLPVLVDFWAPWCGPCRTIAPHVEAIGEEFVGRLKVAKVNVDNNPGIAGNLGIMGIPALFVFKGGEVVNRMQGMPPNARNRLRTLVEPALG